MTGRALFVASSAIALTCLSTVASAQAAPSGQAQVQATESARLNAWFDEQYDREAVNSPMGKTSRGVIDKDYGKWDDLSPASEEARYQRLQKALAEMKAKFDYNKLDRQAKLSWRMYEYSRAQAKAGHKYRDYWYTFNQIFGQQTAPPTFLISQHRIAEPAHAEAYIARLEGMGDHLRQSLDNSKRRFKMGIYPPRFVYDHVLRSIDTIVVGAPFDSSGTPSALWQDFSTKVDLLAIPAVEKQALKDRASAALLKVVRPAYAEVRAEMERQKAQSNDDEGAWKLPDGAGYYAYRLENMTTTKLSAEQIHQIGLTETARIIDEMRAVAAKAGFKGNLNEFVASLRANPALRYPDNEQGRAQYLADATAVIDTMRGRLDELFLTKPKAKIEVRAVEKFREGSAAGAFYSSGALDGSRPGVFYINLGDMENVSKYAMQALAYHEGIPGHHMQISIAQELEGIPKFRKFGGNSAFSEGWGLYSERIPQEIGLYTDPYSDYGRLSLELLRSVRLVVDTGIHHKRWTVEQARKWMEDNTPSGGDRGGLERYVVMPGQATAYMIGMLKIRELRSRAEKSLGTKFDIRTFHDVVLKNGAVPLSILEELVDEWIADTNRA